MDLELLKNIAVEAACSAGNVIQEYLNEEVPVEHKKGGTSYASQVVTAVDRECEAAILTRLLPTCDQFNLALVTEEQEDDGSRFLKDYFWCIDPMDGTLAFINKIPGFSVSIALLARDGTPFLGVVYDPVTDNLYHAIKGNGAYQNGDPLEIKHFNDHLTYVSDRKLKDTPRAVEIERILNEQVDRLKLSGFAEISGGGSVFNAIQVLENGPACMLKFPKEESGGGSIWDYAATACIYQELGLSASNFAGGKLDLNKKGGTYMNHQGVFFANFENNNSK